MMKFNNEATGCQQGQAEKQHYNRVVGSKSLTINKKDKDVLKLKFKEEFYYDYQSQYECYECS
jgi:hypothetical protein